MRGAGGMHSTKVQNRLISDIHVLNGEPVSLSMFDSIQGFHSVLERRMFCGSEDHDCTH